MKKADKSAARSSFSGKKDRSARDGGRDTERGSVSLSFPKASKSEAIRDLLQGKESRNQTNTKSGDELSPEKEKEAAIVSVKEGTRVAKEKKGAATAKGKEVEDDLLTGVGETLGAAALGFAVGGPVGALVAAGLSTLASSFGPTAERVEILGSGAVGFASNPIGTIIDTIGSFAGTFKEGQQVSAASRFFSRAALGAALGGPIGMFIGAGVSLFQDAGVFRGEAK